MKAKELTTGTLRYMVVEPDGYRPDLKYPCVILLHGFGAHMGDLAGLAPAIDSGGYLYICPNAPVSLGMGFYGMSYAWMNPPEGTPEDIAAAKRTLESFFDEVLQRHNIKAGHVVLGGFSQGGLLTYVCGLPHPHLFRGLFVLSSWISDYEGVAASLPSARTQPIFIAHGSEDTLIPVDNARWARRFLEKAGYKLEYAEYEMSHEIRPETVEDLAEWLHETLPPLQASNNKTP